MALSHLGQRAINSITEGTVNALKCVTFFDSCRDALLREHGWNFATKRVALAEISGETVLGWDYLYSVPSLCLYVRSVFTEDTLVGNINTEFRELISPTTNVRAIATNLESAYCEYTVQVTDTTLFDPMFVDALSYKLASKLAQPLCGNVELGKTMYAAYLQSVAEAKRLNKCENNEERPETSSYIDVR